MKKYMINLPDGSDFMVDTVDVAVEVLFSEAINWKSGSGDASIEDVSFDGTRELQIMCRPGFGFILSYLQIQMNNRQYLFAAMDRRTIQSPSNLHSVFVGGDFYNYPSVLFQTPETTKLAIAEFMEADGPPASVYWVDNLQRPVAPEGQVYGQSY